MTRREKQEVFPAAARNGFTTARNMTLATAYSGKFIFFKNAL